MDGAATARARLQNALLMNVLEFFLKDLGVSGDVGSEFSRKDGTLHDKIVEKGEGVTEPGLVFQRFPRTVQYIMEPFFSMTLTPALNIPDAP